MIRRLSLLAAACVLAPGSALANNDLNASFRTGSIPVPSIDGTSPSDADAVSVEQGRVGYRVPIAAPPGRKGVEPEIALVYGGRGDGPLGAGWSLSIPSVAVRTSGRGGQPQWGVDERHLGFSGEELVATGTIADQDGDGLEEETFREERDLQFIRYVRLSGVGFRADYPDGRKLLLGTTAAARVERTSHGWVARYLPEVLVDPSGNQLVYTWSDAPAIDARAVSTTQRYLTSIRWGCQSCNSASVYQEMRFDYLLREDIGAAPNLDFTPTFLVATELGLSTITTASVGGSPAGDVRTYTLAYDASGSRLTLSSVTVTTADAALPPVAFTYTDAAPQAAQPEVLSAVPGVQLKAGVQAMDQNKDGRVDLVDLSNVNDVRLYSNNATSGAGFASVGTTITSPPGVAPTVPTVSLEDENGDLGMDLVDLVGAQVFRHQGIAGWLPAQGITALPSIAFGQDTVRVDVDLDSHPDLIDTSNTNFWTIYFNDGADDYTRDIVECSTTGGQELTPQIASVIHARDAGALFGDVNGDGLVDLTVVDALGDARFFPGRGRGCWGFFDEDGYGTDAYQTLTVTAAGGLPRPANLMMADVDGDGFDDLLEVLPPSRVSAWLHQPGQGWSDTSPAGPWTQVNSTTDGCRPGDFDHDGIMELLCSASWKMYDFGDQVPYLLASVDNGLGMTTTFTYSTSARIAAAHAAAGTPWLTNVASAVPVVSSVVQSDGRGQVLKGLYDYRDAYYVTDELEDRFEFVGFGYVAHKQVPLLESAGVRTPDAADPGVLTRRYYNVGATDWYLRGVPVCEETWPAASVPTDFDCGDATGALRRVERTYSVELDGDGIATVVLDVEDQYLLEGAPAGEHLRSEYFYDGFGNLGLVWNYGQWSGAVDDEGQDEQAATTDYIVDTGSWNLRLPKRMQRGRLDSATGAPAIDVDERTEFRYDGAGDWDTDVVSVGLRTATDRWTFDPLTGTGQTVTVEETTYTAAGLPRRITDASGEVTELGYDGDFHLFKISETVDPGGLALTTTSTVDPRTGVRTSVTEPDAATTTASYDLLGRMTGLVRPGDSVGQPTLTRSYVMAAPVSTITEVLKDGTADGLTTTSLLDASGRLLCQTGEATAAKLDVLVQREYSARGQLVLEWLPSRESTCEVVGLAAGERIATRPRDALVVDPLGRPLRRSHQPSRTFRSWRYSPLAVTESDEEDTKPGSPHRATPVVRTTDGQGRIVAVTEHLDTNGDGVADPITTTYEWTALGQLAEVVDPLGAAVFSAIYDSRGRRVWETDPDRGDVATTWDAMDRIASTVDARGALVEHTYDAAGRIETTTESLGGAPGPVTTYHYDSPAPGYPAQQCRNTAARLAFVEDATGTTVFCYDANGHATRIDKTIDQLGAAPLRLDRTFDTIDRMTTTTHPDGTRLTWSYGKDGRQSRLTVKGGLAAGAPTFNVVSSATYNAAGKPTALALGNGTMLQLAYDDRLRPERHLARNGGTVHQNLGLTLDGVGNVTAISDGAGTNLSATFTYDALYRLTAAHGARFGGHTASYAYDLRGNLVSKTSTDVGSITDVGAITYRADRIHAVDSALGAVFTYDAAGNLADDGAYTFTYDPRGMLQTVSSGGAPVVTNGYDYALRRVVKDSAAGSDVFYFPEAGLEIRGGVAVKHIQFSGRTVARLEGTFANAAAYASQMRFLATDHLGAPSVVLDTTGAVLERWAGHPHGEDNPAPFTAAGLGASFFDFADPATLLQRRFQGREINAEDGTYDFGSRVYRADLGRFMSPDPVVPDPGLLVSWNRYAFARNNPLTYVDPSGNTEMYFDDRQITEQVANIGKQVAVNDEVKAAMTGIMNEYKGQTVDFSWQAGNATETHAFEGKQGGKLDLYGVELGGELSGKFTVKETGLQHVELKFETWDDLGRPYTRVEEFTWGVPTTAYTTTESASLTTPIGSGKQEFTTPTVAKGDQPYSFTRASRTHMSAGGMYYQTSKIGTVQADGKTTWGPTSASHGSYPDAGVRTGCLKQECHF